MKLVLASSILLVATATAWLASASPRPATPLFGPGAVIDLHKQLFAAIDAGDAARVTEFLDPSSEGGWADGEDGGLGRPSLMLLDVHGLPVFAEGAEAARELLATEARASKDGGPPWSTKILKSRADCPSGELSYAVLEFERTRGVKGGTQRYRSTALVRWVDGKVKLFHWQVSAADADTAKLATLGASAR